MLLLPLAIIMGIFGYLFKHYPPEEKNLLYGYRTKKALKNEANWKKAQSLFSKFTLKYLPIIIASGILALILEIIIGISNRNNLFYILLIIEAIITIWYLFIIYFKVEKRL
ncbi:SdpI family protein [Staphylococcus sp. NRL 16/872]|uniref:SdpI family protein n=1 Tax=Staphylococcus sp. NRL 16/872 TaxID=2930131 RepID=UPI001FB515F3|nr:MULTISPECIES: SdpI family protein [unclassified Staphylococcus]MCJ1655427.1 SdpI family protein [Staphylococcus sp. NRL 21/187]MCJ1661262.1 SdpI family protein [Staphylococcus sp. NRL 18/288]MCJ1667150.1 SdpI family protein [Staphylococcus sp. NRL 19/737]WEN69632.1 SdpI family protein [Staphylococcus sp. NRL 16/872]